MICPPCGSGDHISCPEVTRELDQRLTPVELVASKRCDCQHEPVRKDAAQ